MVRPPFDGAEEKRSAVICVRVPLDAGVKWRCTKLIKILTGLREAGEHSRQQEYERRILIHSNIHANGHDNGPGLRTIEKPINVI
jgi:hypothetical protein